MSVFPTTPEPGRAVRSVVLALTDESIRGVLVSAQYSAEKAGRTLVALDSDQPTESVFTQRIVCKWCCESLRKGGRLVKRVDLSQPTKVRTCDICRARTFCGEYLVSDDKLLAERSRKKRMTHYLTRVSQIKEADDTYNENTTHDVQASTANDNTT